MIELIRKMQLINRVVKEGDVYTFDAEGCVSFSRDISKNPKCKPYEVIVRQYRVPKNVMEGDFVAGASIIPFVGNKVIVSLRRQDEFTEPGKVSAFGGMVDYGETPLKTAIRELSEELFFFDGENLLYTTVTGFENYIDIDTVKMITNEIKKRTDFGFTSVKPLEAKLVDGIDTIIFRKKNGNLLGVETSSGIVTLRSDKSSIGFYYIVTLPEEILDYEPVTIENGGEMAVITSFRSLLNAHPSYLSTTYRFALTRIAQKLGLKQ